MPDTSNRSIEKLVDHLFRHEAGKMTAALIRLLGIRSYDMASDIVQDTLLQALSTWPLKGVPDNPPAWLHTVAKRKAIDAIRKQQLHQHHEPELLKTLQSGDTLSHAVNILFLETEMEDSQLRMMFACCHPAITYETQVAFILKTLCGLSTSEIARAFLSSEETISKRIYRAREKIREENIVLEVPVAGALKERLNTILDTLYLLFNEGYNASHGDRLIRNDLCEEAMRLCLLLTHNKLTSQPVVYALLALMCFQASRDDSRMDNDGSIVLLRDQDRSCWNKALIEKGNHFLNQAATGHVITAYHAEAMIASCHAQAKSFDETPWAQIIRLYDLLFALQPNAVIAMNRAIAIGYGNTPAQGLSILLAIEGLDNHYLYHAALGDFYAMLSFSENAVRAYDKAITRTSSRYEKELLEKKKLALTSSS